MENRFNEVSRENLSMAKHYLRKIKNLDEKALENSDDNIKILATLTYNIATLNNNLVELGEDLLNKLDYQSKLMRASLNEEQKKSLEVKPEEMIPRKIRVTTYKQDYIQN